MIILWCMVMTTLPSYLSVVRSFILYFLLTLILHHLHMVPIMILIVWNIRMPAQKGKSDAWIHLKRILKMKKDNRVVVRITAWQIIKYIILYKTMNKKMNVSVFFMVLLQVVMPRLNTSMIIEIRICFTLVSSYVSSSDCSTTLSTETSPNNNSTTRVLPTTSIPTPTESTTITKTTNPEYIWLLPYF